MKKKVLIVVDMQEDFVSGSLGTKEAQAIVPRVAEKAAHFDGTVIFTLDTHGADYLKTQEGRILPVPHCIKGTAGHRLVPELENLAERLGAEKVEKEQDIKDWAQYSQWIAAAMSKRMSELGLTQKMLAEKMGCTQQYISKVLKGKKNMSLETICKIENALGIEIIKDLNKNE